MVNLSQQGAWTKWEGVKKKKITWQQLWRSDFSEVRFMIQLVYDILPSPSNLQIWGKSETPGCQLCSRRSSLQHILSSCPKALGDGRYRWRHDLVLRAIASEATEDLSESKYQPHRKIDRIIFVKEGKQNRVRSSMLSCADDRQLVVDLETTEVPQTYCRNITVSWEEHMIIRNYDYERKRFKYQELVEQCQRKAWRINYDPMEVGCRGFAGQLLCKALAKIGILGAARSRAQKEILSRALNTSKWIWLKRSNPWERRKNLWKHTCGQEIFIAWLCSVFLDMYIYIYIYIISFFFSFFFFDVAFLVTFICRKLYIFSQSIFCIKVY